MARSEHQPVIIGAGVAGLVAALHLEEAGHAPILLDAADHVGGRVGTDEEQGFLLDHGFQVLLTAYQEARRYLDFDQLDLRKFEPGALIFADGKAFPVSDPIRKPSALPTMALSPVGSPADKFRMWKLTRQLKAMDRSACFEQPPQSTLAYLQAYGFSDRVIERFFRPFFGGIFLERELETDASMFRFVFKMFSEGHAAIPNRGMAAIPRQLRARLKQTDLRLSQKVLQVAGSEIRLEGGEKMTFRQLILATEPSRILPNLHGQGPAYRTTTLLYFKAAASPLHRPHIALVAEPGSPVNNWCVLTDVAPGYGPGGEALLSVSLREGSLGREEEAPRRVAEALQNLRGMGGVELEFLRRYDIPRALPVLSDMVFDMPPSQTRLTDNIFLAGDHLLNPSLDAAMRSGRNAAMALLGGY